MKAIYKLLSIACVLSVVACGNNTTSNNNNENNPKKDMISDMSNDMDPKEDMEDMTCQPKATCDAGVCGMVDDGCGGTLDCGAPKTCADLGGLCGSHDDGCGGTIDCGQCLCENGQPTQPTCDVCGLIELQCDGDQSSCKGASVEELDGVSESDCAKSILYVDASYGPGGNGTKTQPYDTVVKALDDAKIQTEIKAIVIAGSATYEGTLVLKSGVSILGGYSSNNWLPNPQERPTIQGSLVAGQDVFGIKAQDIEKPTLLRNLKVTTPDAPEAKDNYGLYIIRSSKLALYRVSVDAGKGGQGKGGDVGEAGFPTTPNSLELTGKFGGDGEGVWNETRRQQIVSNGLPLSNEGINSMCSGANGGRGGGGAFKELNSIVNSMDGQNAASGTVGGQGANDSFPASDGKDGVPFTAGAQGGAGGIATGQVDGFLFIRPNAHGSDGSDGSHGPGGAGGGGGWLDNYFCDNCGGNIFQQGPQGGGGGAGGCGGKAGKGGQAGGNSFGLFAVNSSPLKAEFSSFLSAGGGQGGAGGDGGAGGKGSFGRTGGRSVCWAAQGGCKTLPTNSWGSAGGDGADGQVGGPGGGGAGGSSFGAYCVQSVLSGKDIRFTEGPGGLGGMSTDKMGQVGESSSQVGCM